jgi:hypothetical protein
MLYDPWQGFDPRATAPPLVWRPPPPRGSPEPSVRKEAGATQIGTVRGASSVPAGGASRQSPPSEDLFRLKSGDPSGRNPTRNVKRVQRGESETTVATTDRDLSGVLIKLDRAEAHIETVREQIAAFREREPAPFGFRAETAPGPDNSFEYVLYAVVRELPPRELAPIIGDAIHNMRSALDHLVYALAPPEVREKSRTQFPIFTDESQFKVRGAPMIAGIVGDERTLIEHVQPYAASNLPCNDPLAILSKLSNLDKHRLLVPIIAAVSTTDTWVGTTNARLKWTHLEPGPVQHDTRIVAFTASPEDPSEEMVVQPASGLELQLRDTGAVGLDLDVVQVLHMIHHHIRHSIIAMWFHYGFMPMTWAQARATQQTEQ